MAETELKAAFPASGNSRPTSTASTSANSGIPTWEATGPAAVPPIRPSAISTSGTSPANTAMANSSQTRSRRVRRGSIRFIV